MASVSGAHSSRTLLDIIPHYSKSKSAVDVGSVRLKSLVGVTPLTSNTSRFPKLEECAHFHYEHVDLQPILLEVVGEENNKGDVGGATLRVTSGTENWLIRRTYDHFCKLDEQLHQCVFDRKFSELPSITSSANKTEAEIHDVLDWYIRRLSCIWSGCAVSCGPVLSWFELDNRGRRIVASGHGINTPAVAAAFATTPYTANATDELSFQIGDMISVIDMPPAEESSWWRGKRGFVVGFFPSNCVAVITDKIPTEITLAEPSKPVLRKHGKLIAFFRAFILSRPSRRRLKQTGILKERVFGCDLSEHLLNTGREIPLVLNCCAEFIEAHGIVDGIYRLSGVTSNIQRLRSIFDEDRIPVLEEDSGIKQDVHGVASLLKMYFRELPNPLCTYQLYDEFVAAVQSPNDQRLDNMRKVVQKLPPPHYRTLEYLMGHLGRVCGHSTGTGMTARNVAIVWAPNLLRCRSLDQGVAALQGVGVQAVVTEFLILYAPIIFNTQDGDKIHLRPKSLAVSSPTKLLTLEEAMARGQHSPASCTSELPPDLKPASGHPSFHTVIDLPRKRQPLNWRTIFTPRRNLQPKSPRRIKRKTIIKSAEFLSSSLTGERPGAHQASGPSTANHSRSVSHDSYFDNNIEHKSTSSLVETQHEGLSLSLDLSELQMNFELEESEMRIFSEDETNQLFSSGASIAFGVLENDMNLEKRFSTQNLRYIDSYSPDPMEGETPSDGLQTPGYQPLLVSTPGSYENVRISSCFDSNSSKKSDISPFTYKKLVDSPNNADFIVQKRENDLYEPSTPTGGSIGNVYEIMDLEQEIYEPVATIPMDDGKDKENHYENESVAQNVDSGDSHNIYEDIRCASTADIYEQVSNFRNSVNEVNTLANEGLSNVGKSCETLFFNKAGGMKATCENTKCETTDSLPKSVGSPAIVMTESISSSLSKLSAVELRLDDQTVVDERHIVPDFKSLSDTSDETFKTFYQNINLSPDIALCLKNKNEDESPTNGDTAQSMRQSDEPNFNVNLSCDSNLSASNLSNNISEDNISITLDGKDPKDVTAITEVKDSLVHPTCSIVAEMLKSDWVGRTKGIDIKESDEKLAIESTEPDKIDEEAKKILEIEHQNDGGGAQSMANRDDLHLQLHATESDLERRERIERYKEERRNFFRNKYKTDSLNNNEERDNELIRRIKQKTKKELRCMDLSPSDEDVDLKKSPSKTTVSISYSPTKAKTFDLGSKSMEEDIAPSSDARSEEDRSC